jgi:diguanylate cyclase (GGDEF)-like protein
MFFILFVSFVAVMFTFEHKLSFEKVDNLNNQKKIISTLTKLKKDDVELALIQFNGKSTQLLQEIDKLKNMYKYSLIDRYVLGNRQEYLDDLEKLKKLTLEFNQSAHEYYVKNSTKDLEKIKKDKLENAFEAINKLINDLLLKNISYNQKKFSIINNIVIAIFILVFFATIWYRRRLNYIYKDIEYLYQIDKGKKSHEIFSLEADAISLRMNRKSVTTDNASMIDPVTGINNHKGMLNTYSTKKGLKDSNFTSVTILEIDNFSKSRRTFSQEITQAMLKKVAYTISLHELPIDVIARTDYNQFTLILSRPSKEQSFKDVELIRQSISELKFNIPNKGPTNITVSGGFVIKPNNTNLDEALKQAYEILKYAKTTGINKILQTRDLAERDM